MSDEEIIKEVFEWQNKLRTDPTFLIPHLESMLEYFDGNVLRIPGKTGKITKEGPDAVKEAIDYLKTAEPVSALIMSEALCKASQDHAKDLGANNMAGHDGSDGSSMSDRIERYCQWNVTIGENCSFRNPTGGGRDYVIGLFVDDGVPSRGHRKNIFNEQFKYVGIAVADHPTYTKCCVMDYAGGVDNIDSDDNEDAPPVKNLMSNEELVKEVFDCQNKLRTDPTYFVPYLESKLEYFDGNVLRIPGETGLITYEGPDSIKEAIDFLKNAEPINALIMSKALCKASQDHADDHETNGIRGHVGSDGSSMRDRIERHCKWNRKIGENCSYTKPKNGGLDFAMQLLVDDGVPSRGHRKNIFNPEFNYVGIAVAGHPQYGKCCILDYSRQVNNVDSDDHEGAPPVKNLISEEEIIKEVFEWQNKLRTDPTFLIPHLESMLEHFDGNVLWIPGKTGVETNEGPDAIKEAIDYSKTAKPVNALIMSKALCKASQDHADDLGANNMTGHDGSDGSSMSDRIIRYCKWKSTIGENCDFRNPESGGRDHVIGFFVDDGVPSRGHRKNIFNPEFKYVGIAVADHPTYKKCCVMDYAGGVDNVDSDDHEDAPSVANFEVPESERKPAPKKDEEVEVQLEDVPEPIKSESAKQLEGEEGKIDQENEGEEADINRSKEAIEKTSNATNIKETKEEEKQPSSPTTKKENEEQPSNQTADEIKEDDEEQLSNIDINEVKKDDEKPLSNASSNRNKKGVENQASNLSTHNINKMDKECTLDSAINETQKEDEVNPNNQATNEISKEDEKPPSDTPVNRNINDNEEPLSKVSINENMQKNEEHKVNDAAPIASNPSNQVLKTTQVAPVPEAPKTEKKQPKTADSSKCCIIF